MTADDFERRFVVGLGGAARLGIWNRFRSMALDELSRLDIRCELWLNGSFITKCDAPSDIDGSLMVESTYDETLSDEAVNYLNLFDDSSIPFHETLDIYLCVVYPREHELRGGFQDPDGWAEQWSSEHNSGWLKGFAVIPLR